MASKSMDKYLRKYMSKEDLSKKKRSKTKGSAPTESLNPKKNLWKIVDDDIDMKKIEGGTSDLLDLELGEDAPQIAGIIDERPVTIQAEERYGSYRWKTIGADADKDETRTKTEPNVRKTARKSVKKPRNDSDSDQSPPRTANTASVRPRHDSESDSDMSPPRKTVKNDAKRLQTGQNPDSDTSPPRKTVKNHVGKRQDSDSDLSPERKSDKKPENRTKSVKIEPKSASDSDLSPPRVHDGPPPPSKMTVTLDGKAAGLQSGSSLRAETANFRQRETEMFDKMDKSVSGHGAVAILREKRTGRKQDLVEKERRIREKAAKQAEREAKYMKWGKGLKQIEMKDEKMQNDLKEMDKPLARYANDVDLDKYLRAQERDGDPMLKYLKKKKPDNDNPTVADDDDGKPRYSGCAQPNRFKIRPGFRWDGVDRSNGFEKERFSRLANGQAQELDVYKWSIEDM